LGLTALNDSHIMSNMHRKNELTINTDFTTTKNAVDYWQENPRQTGKSCLAQWHREKSTD